MKFSCDRDEILKSVTYAESVISQKATLTILQNVLFEAEGGELHISSTDLEVGFKTKISATIQQEGDITIFGKKLLDVIKSFPPCNLTFDVEENNRVKVYSGDKGVKAVFHINGIARIDFPEIPRPVTEKYFEFPQKDFKDMIRKTLYAVSHEETRFFLNGAFFEKDQSYIKMVSTDGRRLSYIHRDYPLAEEDFGIIIPKKILSTVVSVLSSEGNLKIAVGQKQIFFEIGSMYFVSNLLDGNFPNYKQVIPEEYEIRITLNTQELATKVERVSRMADNKTFQVIISLSKDKLLIIARNTDIGDAKDEIETAYSGPDMEIGFNFQYLLGALKEVEEDNVNLDIISPNNPITVRGSGVEDYLAIIMPMKITS
jgi:DNA polymerase-3 subunit beta